MELQVLRLEGANRSPDQPTGLRDQEAPAEGTLVYGVLQRLVKGLAAGQGKAVKKGAVEEGPALLGAHGQGDAAELHGPHKGDDPLGRLKSIGSGPAFTIDDESALSLGSDGEPVARRIGEADRHLSTLHHAGDRPEQLLHTGPSQEELETPEAFHRNMDVPVLCLLDGGREIGMVEAGTAQQVPVAPSFALCHAPHPGTLKVKGKIAHEDRRAVPILSRRAPLPRDDLIAPCIQLGPAGQGGLAGPFDLRYPRPLPIIDRVTVGRTSQEREERQGHVLLTAGFREVGYLPGHGAQVRPAPDPLPPHLHKGPEVPPGALYKDLKRGRLSFPESPRFIRPLPMKRLQGNHLAPLPGPRLLPRHCPGPLEEARLKARPVARFFPGHPEHLRLQEVDYRHQGTYDMGALPLMLAAAGAPGLEAQPVQKNAHRGGGGHVEEQHPVPLPGDVEHLAVDEELETPEDLPLPCINVDVVGGERLKGFQKDLFRAGKGHNVRNASTRYHTPGPDFNASLQKSLPRDGWGTSSAICRLSAPFLRGTMEENQRRPIWKRRP